MLTYRPIWHGLAVFALAGAVSSIPAAAQDTPASDQAAQKLERVEITGSSIKRIEGETALPVQVISHDDIQKSGASSVEELLQKTSVVAGAGGLVTASNAGALTGGISAASLRGLGSQRTLILVNGRRVSPYGIVTDATSVDVNSLPLAAIERIEILKEGASAVYGSDAIAGVINFILRKEFQGAEVGASYAITQDGGGGSRGFNGIFGFGSLQDDKFNVMMSLNYSKQDELHGRDRNFASQGFNATPDGYDSTSRNTYPGNITIPGVGRVNPAYPNCAPSNYDPNFDNNPLNAYNQCRFDPAPYVTLQPKTEAFNIFGSAHYAVTSDITAFAELSYNNHSAKQTIQPSPVSNQFALPPGNPLFFQTPYYNGTTSASTILLNPTSPYYPTSYVLGAYAANGLPVPGTLPSLNVNYRTFYNGGRSLQDVNEAPRIALGLDGTFKGFDFNVALTHTESKVTEHTLDGFWVQSQLLPILNSGNVNFFGNNDPAVIAQMQATNFNGVAFTNKTTLTALNGKVSTELFQLPAGALAVAAGGELRRETFDFEPNAYLYTGDISGYGGNNLPEDKARRVEALFAEVDAPLLKTLDAGLSVRYDNYQNSGSLVVPKGSLRWQALPSVLFRASAGRGFRAPSLSELYQANTQDVTPTVTDPLDCVNKVGAGCSGQFPQSLGGNAHLKSETSNNISWGFVLEPVRNVSAAFDFYSVRLKNPILQGGVNPTQVVQNPALYGYLITRSTTQDPLLAGHFPITLVDGTNLNVGAERTSGVDIDLRAALAMADLGKLVVSLTGTYVSKFDLQNPDGTWTPQVATANQTLDNTGGIIPRWKHRLTFDWQRDIWDVALTQNFQLGYEDYDDGRGPPLPKVGDYQTFDLSASYRPAKGLQVAGGILNVANKNPPFTGSGGSNYFQSGYEPSYADPRGRVFYVNVSYKIK